MTQSRLIFIRKFKNIKYLVILNKLIYLIGFIVFVLSLGFFALGFWGGWFSRHGYLDKFPEITDQDRILIFAPHPDDETLGLGGLIQQAVENKARVKIVYATNGDKNEDYLVNRSWKNLIDPNTYRFNPENFIQLGTQRQQETIEAVKILGVGTDNLIFLGYPDGGLLKMLTQNYTIPFVAKGTRFNYSPYEQTYKPERKYTGKNLTEDLTEIINDFKPTKIFVTHIRDRHSDHHALVIFLEKALSQSNSEAKVYYYLIHFHNFPLPKGLRKNEILYPPRNLFVQKGWLSLSLTEEERTIKENAIKKYKSQIIPVASSEFMFSFVRRNEIFEEANF